MAYYPPGPLPPLPERYQSPEALHVLQMLADGATLTRTQMALRGCNVLAGNGTYRLVALEGRGYISSQPAPRGARAYTITEAGRKALATKGGRDA